jgi:hypothetical protein
LLSPKGFPQAARRRAHKHAAARRLSESLRFRSLSPVRLLACLGCPPRPPNPNPSSVLSPPATHRNPSFPDRWGGGRSAAWRPWPRRAAGSSSTSSSIPPPVSCTPRPLLLARSGCARPRGASQLVRTWIER